MICLTPATNCSLQGVEWKISERKFIFLFCYILDCWVQIYAYSPKRKTFSARFHNCEIRIDEFCSFVKREREFLKSSKAQFERYHAWSAVAEKEQFNLSMIPIIVTLRTFHIILVHNFKNIYMKYLSFSHFTLFCWGSPGHSKNVYSNIYQRKPELSQQWIISPENLTFFWPFRNKYQRH